MTEKLLYNTEMRMILVMRVWFSGRTPPCQGGDAVSITATRTIWHNAKYFGER